ncbi:MAG: rod shape-determining protein RodA, partial [Cyclobacteriaceae bacterium]
MTRRESIVNQMDWLTISLFFLIVILGWLNIYAAVYNESDVQSIFSLDLNSGRQFLFILGSVVLIIMIMVIDFRFYDTFAYFIYGAVIAILIFVLLFGREVAGSKSWFEMGPFRLQPSEFAKFATALAVSKLVSTTGFRIDRLREQAMLFIIIGIPAVLIILQGDTGTALVFSAFVLVFYREGMSPFLLILGIVMSIIFFLTMLIPEHMYLYAGIGVIIAFLILIGKKNFKRIALIVSGGLMIATMILSVDYVFNNVLKPPQQNRILTLIEGPEADPRGAGYNVLQSKIAIGSGGFSGKGFLNGTQTKYDYVPEQSTDFIFCTIGEEHGWIGSLILIGLFVALMLRVIYLAERQKS